MYFLVATARVNELLNSPKVRCRGECIRYNKEQQDSHHQNWFCSAKCSTTRGAEGSDTSPTAPAELSSSNVTTVMWLYHTKDLCWYFCTVLPLAAYLSCYLCLLTDIQIFFKAFCKAFVSLTQQCCDGLWEISKFFPIY